MSAPVMNAPVIGSAPRPALRRPAPARPAPARPAPSRRGPRDGRLPAPLPARGSECRGTVPVAARPRPTAPAASARVIARRRAVAGVLAGAALAGLVWVFAIIGGNLEAASAPEPVTTSVVHVRGGETLTAVAARVAPDMPRQAVINQLRALNSMTSPNLTVGQALVVPVYR